MTIDCMSQGIVLRLVWQSCSYIAYVYASDCQLLPVCSCRMLWRIYIHQEYMTASGLSSNTW